MKPPAALLNEAIACSRMVAQLAIKIANWLEDEQRKQRSAGDGPERSESAAADDVPLKRFRELTGISPKAVYNRIARGQWLEGYEFHRSEVGGITIHLPGYHRWARGEKRIPSVMRVYPAAPAAPAEQARKSGGGRTRAS